MHLGNILFIKNLNNETNNVEYKIGIIDYGICLELDVKDQNFVDKTFTECMVNFNLYNVFVEVMNHLKDKYNDKTNHELILEEIKTFVDKNNFETTFMSHYDVYTFLKITRKHNLNIPQKIYNMLLAFVSFLGTASKFLSVFKTHEEKLIFMKKNWQL